MGTTGVDASAAARRCGKRAVYSRDAAAALSCAATARRTLSRWRCPCTSVLTTSCSALSTLRFMYSGLAKAVAASAATVARERAMCCLRGSARTRWARRGCVHTGIRWLRPHNG